MSLLAGVSRARRGGANLEVVAGPVAGLAERIAGADRADRSAADLAAWLEGAREETLLATV